MGRLTVEELLDAIEKESIETVLVAVPDWYGRLMGKRLTGRFFAQSVAEHGWHACDYLLACDMEMDPVPGYAFTSWESGYGDMRCVPDWATLCKPAWLAENGPRALRSDLGEGRLDRGRSAQDPPTPDRARGEDGIRAQGRRRARALSLQGNVRLGAAEALARSRSLRQLHRGLPRSPGHARRARHRRAGPSAREERHPDGRQQGRVGPRAAGGQRRVLRAARAGRPQRPDQTCRQRDRAREGARRDVHGEMGRALCRQQSPPAPLAVERRRKGKRLCRRGAHRRDSLQRSLPVFSRRPACACGGADGVLGAIGELLQALSERVVRADDDRLERGQPHGRLPGRRQGEARSASSAGSREPTPTPTSPGPRPWRRGSRGSRGASSRPRPFRATSTRPRRCRACRPACATRSHFSPGAGWRKRPSATRSSRTTFTSSGPSSASSTRS